MTETKTDEEMKAAEQKWTFTSQGKWHMMGRGDVYTVMCPIRCYGFEWIIGKTATIDGKELQVLGIERFSTTGAVGKGQAIGILVNSMNY